MNTQRLLENLATYAEIGALPNGGVERLALSSTDKQARDMFKKQMLEAGLDVKVDEIGNMFGIRKGTSALPAVMIGSHLDTVGNGGKFDGSLGVLAALEIIHTLNERNLTTKRPIIIANFTNEEGVRFTPDMMGSLVFSRQYLVDKAYQSKAIDGSGTLLAYELDKIGYKGKLKCGSLNIDYFLELHIEQGPILEKENIPVGIVESLQGISWTEFIFYGESNHAGTTPLAYRKDAGLAAVALATYINESVRTKGGNQVGTVGIIEMFPNQINV
ncbi:MAG: hydantoinase/carbamoylase family amidase, partial [Bacteroidota bacterium]